MTNTNGISRRAHVEHRTELETEICELIGKIEDLGAHPLLTDVVVHLDNAFNALADWVELGLSDTVDKFGLDVTAVGVGDG
jgi:hypothetical protein